MELSKELTSVESTDSVNSGVEGLGKYAKKIDKLIEREEIKGTPFVMVTEKDQGTYAVMGDYRITEPMKKSELEQMIYEKDWKFITSVIAVIVDATVLMRDQINKNNDN